MNKKPIIAIVSFLLGAGTGGIGAYIFVLKKYQNDFSKKQKEMIEYYEKKSKEPEKPKQEEPKPVEKPRFTKAERRDMMEEARKIAEQEGYKRNYGKIFQKEKETDAPDDIPAPDDPLSLTPYVIDETEFGSMEMYEIRTLHLYSCGTVTDDDDEPLSEEEIENLVTLEAVITLKEDPYKDSIYVRNDRLRIDYEIIEEVRRYQRE